MVMFDSGILALDLIQELQEEVDIAVPIADVVYCGWLNSLQYLLYTEFIREQRIITIQNTEGQQFEIAQFPVLTDESPVRFVDIYAVFADSVQLTKAAHSASRIFPNTFYYDRGRLCCNTKDDFTSLTVIYFAKPALVAEEQGTITGTVALPLEFVDMARAKLRAEAYKLANENILAANWVNEYNVLLENFKAWIGKRAPDFEV